MFLVFIILYGQIIPGFFYFLYDILTFFHKSKLEWKFNKVGKSYFKINNSHCVSDMGHINYCILDNSVLDKSSMEICYIYTG